MHHIDPRFGFSTRRRQAIAATLAAAVLASGCGLLSGDSTDATTTTAAESETLSGSDTGTAPVVTPTPTTAAAADAASTQDPPGPNITAESKLSTAGLGPVQFGQSLRDAGAAAGAALAPAPGGTATCRYYTLQNGPAGIRFVAVDAEIVRIDIDSGSITTVSGYGIGSSRDEIIEAFGERISDGPSLSAMQYVPVDAADLDKRVVWEVDENGTVISLRAGRIPYIEPRVACTG